MNAVLSDCEVLIVGGGIAGCMSALFLYRAGVRNIVMVDSGSSAGEGRSTGVTRPRQSVIRDGDSDQQVEVFEFANRSGSAVLPRPVGAIKMIINLYPCSSSEFIRHHGEDGARRYLELAHKGLDLEKRLAAELLEDPDDVRCLGSLYVADANGAAELKEEFDQLCNLLSGLHGVDLGIQWWDHHQVEAAHGSDADFVAGIFFPKDAIVDSSQLCKSIVKHLLSAAREETDGFGFQFFSGVTVRSIDAQQPHSDLVHTICSIPLGSLVRSKHVVVATGGLFAEPGIASILSPRWSYLVGIPVPAVDDAADQNSLPRMSWPNSPNFFTWGYTHDWCMVNGHVRISGEDHFSALKPPRMVERCRSLADWASAKYPNLKAAVDSEQYLKQYGVYSETPDHCPIVGTATADSQVCYMVGCNAWGQASLSYAASLVPGLLGYSPLTEKQRDLLKLLSIRRFSLLPIVRAEP